MMRAFLEILLQIQGKDEEIRAIENEQKLVPEMLNAAKKKLEDIDNAVKRKKEDLKQIQVTRKDLEINLDTKLINVNKYEAQLFQVKTNEEYKALQKEIGDLKFSASLEEDKILLKMEEIEKVNEEIKKLEEELGGARKEVEEKTKEAAAKLELLAGHTREIREQREKLIPKISPELLGMYNRIFSNKPDVAMVSIVNSACCGCHMKLPPNVINEVRKERRLVVCDNCSRILFWPSD